MHAALQCGIILVNARSGIRVYALIELGSISLACMIIIGIVLIFNYYNLFMVSIMLQFFFGSVCMFTCVRVYVHVLAHMVSYSQIVVAFNSV